MLYYVGTVRTYVHVPSSTRILYDVNPHSSLHTHDPPGFAVKGLFRRLVSNLRCRLLGG